MGEHPRLDLPAVRADRPNSDLTVVYVDIFSVHIPIHIGNSKVKLYFLPNALKRFV